MTSDYSQGFWVGHNNPRFPHARLGYLPPLEREEPPDTIIQDLEWLDMEWSKKQWDAVKQLKSLVLHLQEKLNQHTDRGKTKRSYK